MQPIKVLHIVSTMQRGGVETMIMNFYRHIDHKNVQFDFIVHGNTIGHFENEICKLGGKVYHVTPKTESFLKNLKEVNMIIKQNHYEIVHVHQDAMSMFALREAKKAGAKIRIAHAHSTSMPPSRLGKIIYSYAINNMTRYATHKFACSEASAQYLFNNHMDDVIYIHNGIDIEKYSFDQNLRNKVREEYNWNDKFILGHVGNFLYPKNHSFVIKIFAEFVKHNPNSNLVLCGSGPNRPDIEKQVIDMGINEQVIFMGNVPNVNYLMQGMDCLLLPSIYEGLPVVTVEAQCCDLPIIVSDIITKETHITDAIQYLPLTEKPDVWAKNIYNITNSYMRKDVSQRIIKAGYDVKTIALSLQKIYLELLGE